MDGGHNIPVDVGPQNSRFSHAGDTGMAPKISSREAALGGFVLFMQSFGFMQSRDI